MTDLRSTSGVLACLVIALGAGCKKSSPSAGNQTGWATPTPARPAATSGSKAPTPGSDFVTRSRMAEDVVTAWGAAGMSPGWFGEIHGGDRLNDNFGFRFNAAEVSDPLPGFATTEARARATANLPTPTVPFALSFNLAQANDVTLDGVDRHQTLAALSLAGGEVTDQTLGAVGKLKNLKYLNLSGTRIRDPGLKHLRDHSRLASLNLSHTQISDAGLSELRGVNGLTRLNVSYTGVTDASVPVLAGLNRLIELRIVQTQITTDGLKGLTALPHLEELRVGWNSEVVDERALTTLKEIKSLRRLAWHSDLTETGIGHLKEMPNLTSLDVRSVKLDSRLRDQLKAALPRCEITFGPSGK